ncbi:DUF3426 domain-containing protein [Acidovorax sp. BL-A-41-H1]|uniref:zinc-ribbon and DUF3426 domain-containing protein n=1 Tax=Acidovorax sp. BL-A-41-H1 TaxID=3421102 RepID=UPI003F7A38F8
MSQITRCPACATTFKVVADQLRISEGWVRCGQCKEVFDASAHLLASAAPPLLPDVSMADVRPPPAPVVRKPVEKAWGAGAAPSSASGLASRGARDGASQSPSPLPALEQDIKQTAAVAVPVVPAEGAGRPAGQGRPQPGRESAVLSALDAFAPAHAAAPMDVPEPTVPAFLAASATPPKSTDLSLEPATPFRWRAERQGQGTLSSMADSGMPRAGSIGSPAAPAASTEPPEAAATELHTPAFGAPASGPAPLERRADAALTSPWSPATPSASGGGYELPSADLRDAEEADGLPDLSLTSPAKSGGLAAADTDQAPYPPLELPVRTRASQADAAPVHPLGTAGGQDTGPSSSGLAEEIKAVREGPKGPSPTDSGPSPAGTPAAELPDMESLPAQVVEAAKRSQYDRDKEAEEEDRDEDDALPEPEPEVSFVRAARRKAFWRRPLVRTLLVLLLLGLLAGLAAQVAVQERDRIAATEPRLRPWLVMLCEPMGCELAPRRQIADVVIDSSSFNKARGDSYLLNLTLKNQAPIPLAMPAMELTLTDAQDQPVLRRILLPNDMGAPAEMPARGEWGTSVSVVVTTGGARVAGYRLLAFYP